MKQKQYILFFILIISVSLVTFGCAYNIVSGKSLQENFVYQFIINLPLGIAIGFLNFGVINMMHRRRKIKSNVLRILIDLTVTTFLCVLISFQLNYLFSDTHPSVEHVLKNSLLIIPWNCTIVLLIEIFFYHLRQTEIEKEKALYQFKILKDQINPHFLFNSLNVLASLAYQDAARTNLFAKKLSNVYRYLLSTHERQTVMLEEELQFVDSYLYLEQIRFGKTLQVIIENDGQNQHKAVIPASLQMLVENALKHNVSTSKSPLVIHVAINNNGIIVSNKLQLRNYVTKNRMGLSNLKKQYSLYDKELSIIITKTDFIVEIPFIE